MHLSPLTSKVRIFISYRESVLLQDRQCWGIASYAAMTLSLLGWGKEAKGEGREGGDKGSVHGRNKEPLTC